MARCFVTRNLPGPALDRLARAHDVEIWSERLPPSPERLRQKARAANGLLTLLTDRIDAQLIDQAEHLKAISNYAVGVDNIDLEAATRKGIPVGHTPDVLTDATADLTFALLLAAARRLPQAIDAAHAGDWLTWEPGMHLGQEVNGATLGIVGYGRIGRAVAKRAHGFEMTVLHTSSTSTASTTSRTSTTAVNQGELLHRSDFISLHVPLTPETHHLINARALAQMKPTAILINTARGQIVDQRALAHALQTQTIAGAALDVADPEPLPKGHELYDAPNLLITPHIGSATRAAREQMAEMAVDNLLAGLSGEPMPHQAN